MSRRKQNIMNYLNGYGSRFAKDSNPELNRAYREFTEELKKKKENKEITRKDLRYV